MQSITNMMIACLSVAAASAIEPEWKPFEMEDKTKLVYEATQTGILIQRIYHFTDPAQKSLLWENNSGPGAASAFTVSTRVIGARRFGDTFSVILEGPFQYVSFLRIDTSRTPYFWIKMLVPWEKEIGEPMERPPPIVVENAFEVSFQPKGLEKVTYRVDDSGQVERNGVRIPRSVTINERLFLNGKPFDPTKIERLEPEGNRVWPPKPGDVPGPNQPAGTAPNPGGSPPGIAATTGTSNPLTGRWRLWAGGAGILAILAGWLMRRKRSRSAQGK